MTVKILSQHHPDIPHVFLITGFEEALCQFEIQYRLGFPCGLAGKESTRNVGDLGSIPGLGGSPGEGKGYPPTPVFWPGEFHGLYSLWGRKESDVTERLSLSQAWFVSVVCEPTGLSWGPEPRLPGHPPVERALEAPLAYFLQTDGRPTEACAVRSYHKPAGTLLHQDASGEEAVSGPGPAHPA